MSSDFALRARGLTKIYDERAFLGTGLIRHILGTAQQGSVSQGRTALSCVDLDITRGEAVGVLGLNGAGKTTLLSILSGVLTPTRGTVERRGALVPLLGVGTSFMPELTGRENAELNLLMMGVARKDARARLVAIEAFADIGHHFDAPLWTYSSGMVARVAFAAAMHVEADTMIIDETLSVGDTAFREKCRTALDEVRKAGRTLLLVTHAPPLITRMCSRAIVLDKGRKVFDGTPEGAIETYQALMSRLAKPVASVKSLTTREKAPRVDTIIGDVGFTIEKTETGGTWTGIIQFTVTTGFEVTTPAISLIIRSPAGVILAQMDWRALSTGTSLTPGEPTVLEVRFDQRLLTGSYVCTVSLGEGADMSGTTRVVASHDMRIDIHDTKPTQSVGYIDLNMELEPIGTNFVGRQ